jgi:DNA-binding SARP family transcriptional activator
MTRAAVSAKSAIATQLRLTTEFQLLVGDRAIGVPHGVQRLLAFLAIGRQPTDRSRVAGQLWPDVAEWRALGNLRSALWRLRRIPRRVVRAAGDRLMLNPDVSVDTRELTELCVEILDGVDRMPLRRLSDLIQASEILPGWEEEWLLIERERYRELRLRALERACEAMILDGNAGGAVQTCLAAVQAEPFRESAQRLLVQMHLSEGNRAAALRSYLAYRELVEKELGIEPSELMADLIGGLGVAGHTYVETSRSGRRW